MLFVDYAHLKGARQAGVITASSLDGDDHIYPIAIAAVRGEDNDCCFWFFRMMLESKCPVFLAWLQRHDMIIFTDRGKAFMTSILVRLPTAFNM
jgi:hypothetical protein